MPDGLLALLALVALVAQTFLQRYEQWFTEVVICVVLTNEHGDESLFSIFWFSDTGSLTKILSLNLSRH